MGSTCAGGCNQRRVDGGNRTENVYEIRGPPPSRLLAVDTDGK